MSALRPLALLYRRHVFTGGRGATRALFLTSLLTSFVLVQRVVHNELASHDRVNLPEELQCDAGCESNRSSGLTHASHLLKFVEDAALRAVLSGAARPGARVNLFLLVFVERIGHDEFSRGGLRDLLEKLVNVKWQSSSEGREEEEEKNTVRGGLTSRIFS